VGRGLSVKGGQRGILRGGDLLDGNCYKDADSVTRRTASTHNLRENFAPQVSRQHLSPMAFDGFSTCSKRVRQQAAEINNIQLFTQYRFKATMSSCSKAREWSHRWHPLCRTT
jgi:hypothetical protein